MTTLQPFATINFLVNSLEWGDVFEEFGASDGSNGFFHGERFDDLNESCQRSILIIKSSSANQTPNDIQAGHVEKIMNWDFFSLKIRVSKSVLELSPLLAIFHLIAQLNEIIRKRFIFVQDVILHRLFSNSKITKSFHHKLSLLPPQISIGKYDSLKNYWKEGFPNSLSDIFLSISNCLNKLIYPTAHNLTNCLWQHHLWQR